MFIIANGKRDGLPWPLRQKASYRKGGTVATLCFLAAHCAKVKDAQDGKAAVQETEGVGDEEALLAEPEDADKDA